LPVGPPVGAPATHTDGRQSKVAAETSFT
jgi:hypothetical protein